MKKEKWEDMRLFIFGNQAWEFDIQPITKVVGDEDYQSFTNEEQYIIYSSYQQKL